MFVCVCVCVLCTEDADQTLEAERVMSRQDCARRQDQTCSLCVCAFVCVCVCVCVFVCAFVCLVALHTLIRPHLHT